jgi:putative peptide zinc metalloprotease protein
MSAAPTQAPALPAGQSAENLQPKLRPDLVVQPQFYEGMTHYVVKDPIGLKYFRFKVEEYFLLEQLDGKRTLQEVKKAFERKYRPQTITIEDLTRFVSQLHEAGIVQIDTPIQGRVLVERRRKNRWKRVWQFIANILYVKIPIIDPERLLTAMYPYFRWLFTPWFVVITLTMWAVALGLVVSQWREFTAKLPDFHSFFNWWTIIYFWISLAIVKVIHEFGHGLTAKHYGGEVHEMGMLFLVLTPALYCDVTDSWLLPNKWHRIWISAAGIYVECTLAAIATFIWWNSEPGLLNSLMLATMFICSVNTILFNANPLLRYDGYYVLADWLEIPNLRMKASQFFIYLFQEKVLGLEVPVQNYMPRSRRILFVTYAICSYLYRWLITFSILFFLYSFLPPKLRVISAALALGSLVPLLVMPAYQIGKFMYQPGRWRKVKKARAAAFLAAFLVIATLILMIPTPLGVQGTFVLQPENPSLVYAEVPGQLVELPFRDNTEVKQGDVLAKLVNHDLQRERRALQEQIDVNWSKYKLYYSSLGFTEHGLAEQFRLDAEALEPTVEKLNEQIGKLTLYAPRAGTVMGLPHPEVEGSWLKPESKPFCMVGDPTKLEAHLLLDQSDIDLVREGRKAWVKIYGDSLNTRKSQVTLVAKRSREEVPAELSNLAGGEVAGKADQKTGAVKPVSAIYEVVIPVDNAALLLHPGQRGFAKIDGGNTTLAWWIWRWVTKTFHFTL